MNRLSQKKLLHKYTNTQLMKPTSITNPVRQHGQEQGSVILLLSRLLVRGSAQTHKNFTSGTLLQHSVGCPQNNVFLPRPQPQHLLPSVFFIAGCWHKLPIRLQYKLPAVSGTVLLSVVNLWPKPRFITLRSYLHCHVSHGSFCLGLVCNVLLIMTESLSAWSRQSFMLLCKNEGHFLYTSSQSKRSYFGSL